MLLNSIVMIVMKRMVVLFDNKFKPQVRAFLVANRIQYSITFDFNAGLARVSVPHANGVRLLAELRRSCIPYELL